MGRHVQDRTPISNVFERLTAAIFGGDLEHVHQVKDSVEFGTPDIIDFRRKRSIEVKVGICTDEHKISGGQVSQYESLVSNPMMGIDEGYYCVWRYDRYPRCDGTYVVSCGDDGKERKDMTLISAYSGFDLERELISRIRGLSILSLDVIKAGLSIWPTDGTATWNWYHKWHSSKHTAFRQDPYLYLENELGLNPIAYEFGRHTIDKGEYFYGTTDDFGVFQWLDLPEFDVVSVWNKRMNGLFPVLRSGQERVVWDSVSEECFLKDFRANKAEVDDSF